MTPTAVLAQVPVTPARGARSPIDLLHPGGVARRVAVLGNACPSWLLVPDDTPRFDRQHECDAAILAPDARECRTALWFTRAAAAADRRLAPDGIVYLVVPRRWRSAATRLLEGRGFVAGATYLHLRQGASTNYFVPCDASSVKRLLPALSIGRSAAAIADALWSIPGAAAVAQRGWADVGIVLQRPGARRSAGWMSGGDPAADAPRTLIRCRSRAAGVSAVVTISSVATGDTDTLLKVPLSDAAAVDRTREAEMMARLRDTVSRAGAVMASASVRFVAGRPILHLGVVGGTPATHVLRADPRRLTRTLEDLGAWIARWNLLTRQESMVDRARLQREVIGPAIVLADQLVDGPAYVRWLDRQCAAIAGLPLPLVATHNDLTMSNVVCLSGLPPFAILDWEAARDDGLPLTDFFYAAASALRAARGDGSPSLIESFDGRTPFGRDVNRISWHISHALGLGAGVIEILKHACALQHAINEQRETARGSRPFLALVEWLAATRGARP